MFETEYINENWRQTLQRNHAANFDALWQLQQDSWFEAPNQRRGGWSGVCKTTLTMPDGSESGIFIKRQENHFTAAGATVFSYARPSNANTATFWPFTGMVYPRSS